LLKQNQIYNRANFNIFKNARKKYSKLKVEQTQKQLSRVDNTKSQNSGLAIYKETLKYYGE